MKNENKNQFVKLNHEFIKLCNLNYEAVGLYVFLKRYMNSKTHSTFVSRETILKTAKINSNKFSELIKILIDNNHISVSKLKATDGKYKNFYTFNINSELYNIKFEKIYYDFLDNPNLSFSLKSAYMVIVEYLDKSNKDVYSISSTDFQLSNILNVSPEKMRRIINKFIKLGMIAKVPNKAKDKESGEPKYYYYFNNLELRHQVKQNTEDIKEIKEKLDNGDIVTRENILDVLKDCGIDLTKTKNLNN